MDSGDCRKFLEALFPWDLPDDVSILIWYLKSRKSCWADTVDEAVAQVLSNPNADTYVGGYLAPHGLGPTERGKVETITHIIGIPADIDIFSLGGHKKPNIPQTPEEAQKIIRTAPLPVSLIVNSGHGYHPWWLLHEPFDLSDPKDRERAIRVKFGWQRIIAKRAEALGRTIDSVHDLVRVMRVPGTMNMKGEPVPCSIVEYHPERRYSIDDFEEFIHGEVSPEEMDRKVAKASTTRQRGLVAIDLEAHAPTAKLQTALANNDEFRETWNMRRRDLKDQSLSGYAMSLTNYMVAFGWSDQEITDTLVQFRREHGGAPKTHEAYYVATIDTARASVNKDEQHENLAHVSSVINSGNVDEHTREDALNVLSQWFGFKVLSVTRTESESAVYSIHTKLGSICLGPIDTIMGQAKFIAKIADATLRVVEEKEKDEWLRYKQLILFAVERIDVGHEATSKGITEYWIDSYLRSNVPVGIDDLSKDDDGWILDSGRPLKNGKNTYISMVAMLDWIHRTTPGDKTNRRDLGAKLRDAGWVSGTVRVHGRVLRRWCNCAETKE